MAQQKTQMNYDTLILSGNSTNAVVTLGALQRLYDLNLMNDVKNFVGTSSGSITGLLLAVGYKPIELLCHLCVEKPYNTISCFNIGNLLLMGKSLMKFDPILESVESLVVRKFGKIPTIKDLYETTGNKFVCVTYNLTLDKREYVSLDTHPNLAVTFAIRMSCTFPFIFDPFDYDGNLYLDGGIVDNFAIEYGEKVGLKCIGVYTKNPQKPFVAGDGNIALLHKLVHVFINSLSEDKMNRSNGSNVITINYAPSFFNFTASNSEIIKMFDAGYAICKENF